MGLHLAEFLQDHFALRGEAKVLFGKHKTTPLQ
jgi:hypothetical protein